MLTRSQLIIDVSELLRTPGAQEECAFSEEIEGLSLELARIGPGDAVRFDLTVGSMDDGVIVRGRIRGRYVAVCRRCLSEEPREFGFDVAEVYRSPSEAWEEGYVISAEETIDLEPLTRDNVMLNLPVNPVCTEDCRGLCSRCGANLNEGPCGCPEETDIRWGALRELLPDR